MWLREGSHTPLFSVDYREEAGGLPKVWRDNSSSTARRAKLHLASAPIFRQHQEDSWGWWSQGNVDGLLLEDVAKGDDAVYRCRVDFLAAPTRNAKVNLTVVVPPKVLTVAWVDSRGEKGVLSNGEVGPFLEGDAPTMICYTKNAFPVPYIIWIEDEVVIDDTFKYDSTNGIVVNSVTLQPLARSDQGRLLTCQSGNSNLTSPIASKVLIHIALEVLDVRITGLSPIPSGTPVEMQCTVWGSNPRPVISWSLNGVPLPAAPPWVSEEGNVSVSVVTLTATPEHDGANLTCMAHNPVLRLKGAGKQSSPKRHSITLSVNYPPKVDAWLAHSLDPTRIKEGDDVFFECQASAKPLPHKVEWTHNGDVLQPGSGILISKMTLVLQQVQRRQAGFYACHVTNTQGHAVSQPVRLDVKFAPVCSENSISQHSVGMHENAHISCKVLSNPADVRFKWTFNNTAEKVRVPDDRYIVKGQASVVNYTPMTELDYGTLLCSAVNAIGEQTEPCVFQIVPAGKPDPPHNCQVHNVTISSIKVHCLAGDDGGLNQTFLLQVIDVSKGAPVVELSQNQPTFFVANLQPSTSYRILISAYNSKGESKPNELQAFTSSLDSIRHETNAEPTRGRETENEVALGVILGATLACVPVGLTILILVIRGCLKSRKKRNSDFKSVKEEDSRKLKFDDYEENKVLLSLNAADGAEPKNTSNKNVNKENVDNTRHSSGDVPFTKEPVIDVPPPAMYNQGYQSSSRDRNNYTLPSSSSRKLFTRNSNQRAYAKNAVGGYCEMINYYPTLGNQKSLQHCSPLTIRSGISSADISKESLLVCEGESPFKSPVDTDRRLQMCTVDFAGYGNISTLSESIVKKAQECEEVSQNALVIRNGKREESSL